MFAKSYKSICLGALLAVVACTSGDYELPDLQTIDPAELEAGEASEIIIRGSSFTSLLISDVESGETFVDENFRVVLVHSSGNVPPIDLQDVRYLDDETLSAAVPSDTPSGTFSATVVGPLGEGVPRTDAFTVKFLADATFGTPVAVAGINSNTFNDDDPSLTGDLLELYFKSDRGATLDIYYATRSSASDNWSTPTRVDELSSESIDNTPEVASDGLTIYFSSDRSGPLDQYRSTRGSRSDSWSAPIRVEELSSENADYSVTTDGAGLHLIMNRLGGTNQDLFAAERRSLDVAWSTPLPIAELNTERYEADAVLDRSGLRVLYTTIEATPGKQKQIYGAERDTVDGPFGTSRPLATINTDLDDEDPWISPDLGVIFFTRTSAEGRQDIYMAERASF